MSTPPKKTDSSQTQAQGQSMWGGRFAQSPADLLQEINASIRFDQKLWREDIQGSQAHVRMLAAQNIIAAEEAEQILQGLEQITQEIEQGQFPFREELEDIHMNIEARLREIIGDVAGKLHTGRSRNDQVATDFKLWLRGRLDRIETCLQALQKVLHTQASQHTDTLLPGMTHLQVAQPVSFAHHLLAYVEMFGRDRQRFQDCRQRLNECPLGAAALAGTSFPLDRAQTAANLGFDQPMANSLDAVSDRDFAVETLAHASLCMIHLSRLAEELVLWCSAPYHFIHLSDAFTTGSSIMPQKRNPDAAELIRGKTGRVVGAQVSLLMTLKSLPLAYSKDMQEDKEPTFDAVETLEQCVRVMTGMLADLKANPERMAAVAASGFSTATDLADWLVQTLGMPFRTAHHVTGALVKLAEDQGCDLHELSLDAMQGVHGEITEAVYSVLTPEASLNRRTSQGGTAPVRVREALETAQKKYDL